MSKHGGSPTSGLVSIVGADTAEVIPGSAAGLLQPEIAKRNAEAKERARQFERRRIALELAWGRRSTEGWQDCLPPQADPAKWVPASPEQVREAIKSARAEFFSNLLADADELMAQTGGFVTGAARE